MTNFCSINLLIIWLENQISSLTSKNLLNGFS